jgi:hypothetical protein
LVSHSSLALPLLDVLQKVVSLASARGAEAVPGVVQANQCRGAAQANHWRAAAQGCPKEVFGLEVLQELKVVQRDAQSQAQVESGQLQARRPQERRERVWVLSVRAPELRRSGPAYLRREERQPREPLGPEARREQPASEA